MKNYILCEDISCRYYAKTKQDLIDYVRHYYKNKKETATFESLQDFDIWSISYDARKIEIDDFFGDIIATEKKHKDEGAIEYDDYAKFGIKDKIEKKDFLYYNL